MKMLPFTLSSIFVLVLAAPPGALADFQWLDAWQSSIQGNAAFDSADNTPFPSSYGVSLGANAAVQGTGDLSELSQVTFTRDFRVTGAEQLELFLGIQGDLFGYKGYGQTVFHAEVTGQLPTLDYSATAGLVGGHIDDSRDVILTLTDGTYTLSGNFSALAALFPPEYQNPAGNSASANVISLFQITTTSKAVPEPASLVLLGAGMLGWALGLGRRGALVGRVEGHDLAG